MAILIDDFSTGPDVLEIPTTGQTTGEVEKIQTGNTINGGFRRTKLLLSANPLHQTAHLDVGSGSLNQSTGVNQASGVGISYGIAADPNSPMNLDLRGFDRFRFHFLSSNQVLNLNIVIFGKIVSEGGPGGTERSSVPFTRDFLFNEFKGAGGANADFSAVKAIVVSLQSADFGGLDYAIDSIEVTGIG
jgi:hypothetical protein